MPDEYNKHCEISCPAWSEPTMRQWLQIRNTKVVESMFKGGVEVGKEHTKEEANEKSEIQEGRR